MPTTEKKIGIIILAAGESKRLGEPKQLLPFRGKTLVRRAAETALEIAAEKTIVVTGASAEKIRKEIGDLECLVAFNENWKSGMGSSLKTGMRALTENAPEIGAVIISLCDQPLIESVHFEKLIEKFSETGKPIVGSIHADGAGVPALFARKYFADLSNIDGDRGAKHLINRHPDDAAYVKFSQNSMDIDTPEDYKKLLSIVSE